MSEDWKQPTDNITAVLDAIIKYIPEPEMLEGDAQMLITSLDYSSYVGRIAVGRVHRGTLKDGMEVALCKRDGEVVKQKIKELRTFEGMGQKHVESVSSGDICAIIGIEGFEIGDTVTLPTNPEALPRIAIDEPTMSIILLEYSSGTLMLSSSMGSHFTPSICLMMTCGWPTWSS